MKGSSESRNYGLDGWKKGGQMTEMNLEQIETGAGTNKGEQKVKNPKYWIPRTDPAMGRIVKCVRKSCLHIKSFFLFFVFLLVSIFVFLPPGFGSSPLLERRCNRPGLTCYPYNDFAYTISFPIPGERAETIL